jgi:hypothetical protein
MTLAVLEGSALPVGCRCIKPKEGLVWGLVTHRGQTANLKNAHFS